MANSNPLHTLLLLLFVVFSSSPSVAPISEDDVDAAIAALRSSGYALFGNGIAVSDLLFDLLRRGPNESFTLFAPTDAALFALDMVYPAAAYVRSLRQHVALRHLTRRSLRTLPQGFTVPTLLPSRDLTISHRLVSVHGEELDMVTIDGVDVALPGIFYGNGLAVHGLNGILALDKSEASAGSPFPQSTSPDELLPPAGFGDPPSASPATDLGPVPKPAYPSPVTLPPSFSEESYPPTEAEADQREEEESPARMGGVPTSSLAPDPSKMGLCCSGWDPSSPGMGGCTGAAAGDGQFCGLGAGGGGGRLGPHPQGMDGAP